MYNCLMDRLLKTIPMWLPFAMSALAMVFVLGDVVLYGAEGGTRSTSGWVARIFQFLLIMQIPLMGYIVASHKNTLKNAIIIVASQLVAVVGAAVLVVWLSK